MTAARLLLLLLAAPAATAFSPPAALFSRPSRAPLASSPLLRATVENDASSPLRATDGPLEAILFDCDGVLADTERDGHRLAFNAAFEEIGIDEEWDEGRYGKLLEVGGGKERMTAHWNEVGWPAEIPEEGRSEKIMSLHLRKTDIFMRLIDEGKIPLRPGVLRIVDEAISAGVRLAVCSTSNEKAVSNLVSTLMGPYRASKFRVFAGDMVTKKKPAPDIYLMAVEEMGLDKDRCVIVEDSHIGVGAAVAAGISCLVTKSSYTAGEDFAGAKMIVDELGDDADAGVTLETLSGLLGDDDDDEAPPTPVGVGARGIGVKMEGHVEKGGASWTGARFGDDVAAVNRARPTSAPRGLGVKMEGHIEKGGASWTGARLGDDVVAVNRARPTSAPRGLGVKMEGHVERGGASWTGARLGDDIAAAAAARPSSATRGLGVKMEGHIEKGGASWTGARLGDDVATAATARPSSATRGLGVKMEGHIEKGGASWTGARLGDDVAAAAAARPSSATRGLGVKMEGHVEKGGASWTGARLGDDVAAAAAVRPSSATRGLGVKMEGHIEKGGASWTGARLGDDVVNPPRAYTPSETYEFRSEGKSGGAEWDSAAHTEVPPEGADRDAWSGARFGDENVRRVGPTPSQWRE